ncbi:hypothetical protein DFJ73DRAFT_586547 [Zopfochytrium polystomum]|nr:hypothetical protein DFJ73DRAFT_586547 [Zopfochytrium polystomum]
MGVRESLWECRCVCVCVCVCVFVCVWAYSLGVGTQHTREEDKSKMVGATDGGKARGRREGLVGRRGREQRPTHQRTVAVVVGRGMVGPWVVWWLVGRWRRGWLSIPRPSRMLCVCACVASCGGVSVFLSLALPINRPHPTPTIQTIDFLLREKPNRLNQPPTNPSIPSSPSPPSQSSVSTTRGSMDMDWAMPESLSTWTSSSSSSPSSSSSVATGSNKTPSSRTVNNGEGLRTAAGLSSFPPISASPPLLPDDEERSSPPVALPPRAASSSASPLLPASLRPLHPFRSPKLPASTSLSPASATRSMSPSPPTRDAPPFAPPAHEKYSVASFLQLHHQLTALVPAVSGPFPPSASPSSAFSRNDSARASAALAALQKKRAELVALLKSLGELLIGSDNLGSTDVFDAFFELQTHRLLLKLLPASPTILPAVQTKSASAALPSASTTDPTVTVALLKFFNVLFESVQQESVLYFLFSNNYINDVICSTAVFSKDSDAQAGWFSDEARSYHVTLLKNLSIKLNAETIHLLFNEHLTDFPLFSLAVQYLAHDERMIRIAARAITLNVFKVNEKKTTEFLLKTKKFFANLCIQIGEQANTIIEALDVSRGSNYSAADILDEIIDTFLYLQDIFTLGIPFVSRHLADALLNQLCTPVLVKGITKHGSSRSVCLFLITQLLQSITFPPLMNVLVETIFAVSITPTQPSSASISSTPASSRPGSVSSDSFLTFGSGFRGGAVIGGNGGLFDEMDGGPSSVGASPALTSRTIGAAASDPPRSVPNELRDVIISKLDLNRIPGGDMEDSDQDGAIGNGDLEFYMWEEGISVTLALILLIVRSKHIKPETLKLCGLYPRRSIKSRLLMDSLMADDSSLSRPSSRSGFTIGSESTEDISRPAIPYDATLVSYLIQLIGFNPRVTELRSVTLDLAARLLVEIGSTGGELVKSELLDTVHMESLKSACEAWKTLIVRYLEQGSNLAVDIFNYEARQSALSLDRILSDCRLIISEPPPHFSLDYSGITADPPWSYADSRTLALATKMWILTCECLSALGQIRKVPKPPLNPPRAPAPSGTSIDLNAKILTPCVLLEETGSVNGYFIFDQDMIKFMEVDRLRMGKGKILHSRPILDVRVSYVPDKPFTLRFESHPLVFPTTDAERRTLSLARPFSLTESMIVESPAPAPPQATLVPPPLPPRSPLQPTPAMINASSPTSGGTVPNPTSPPDPATDTANSPAGPEAAARATAELAADPPPPPTPTPPPPRPSAPVDLAMHVSSSSHDIARPAPPSKAWSLAVTFSAGSVALEHVVAHVSEGAASRWADRRGSLLQYLRQSFVEAG